MNIRPIRNEADYDWALAEVAVYFERPPPPGTPDADRFDILSALIEVYENRAWPIAAPDPVSAVSQWMTEHSLSQSDLSAVLGSRSRASELLARKRPLSLAMAQRLHREWRMPAEILIQPCQLDLAA